MTEVQDIKLTRLEKKFADLIIDGQLPDYKAHKKAGYKSKNDANARAAASKLLTKHNVKEYIHLRKAELAEVVKEKQKKDVVSTFDFIVEVRDETKKALDYTNAIKANDQMAKLRGDYAPESRTDESHEAFRKRIDEFEEGK